LAPGAPSQTAVPSPRWALRPEPEEIRHQGAGQLLGRVLEAQARKALALSGGFLALVAALEIAIAAAVLHAGVGGGMHALLLLAWVAVTLLLGWRYYRQRRHWTAGRRTLTHDLVERLVGHRTRLVQEERQHWHDGEDQGLTRYLESSAAMDRIAAWLMAVVPRGWLCLGLLGLAPAFVTGRGSPAALAIGLGGMLLAYRALHKLATGMGHLAGETGWQLSHGERSRLYIARALLQKADLVILDESFAALDPETL
jgi:ATP-binding cassette subfamily B protein